jgi:hypothetical protein
LQRGHTYVYYQTDLIHFRIPVDLVIEHLASAEYLLRCVVLPKPDIKGYASTGIYPFPGYGLRRARVHLIPYIALNHPSKK